MSNERPQKLSIIIFSGDFDKIHYALAMASAAAAVDMPVTLFFTMGASRALLASPENAWMYLPAGQVAEAGETGGGVDNNFKQRTVATFEELLKACISLDVKFMVCDMGLRAMGLEGLALRGDVPIETGGMVTFFNDAHANGQMVFI